MIFHFKTQNLKPYLRTSTFPTLLQKQNMLKMLRATDRKISFSPRLKALRLTFHKHYCLMSNAIYHMMMFILKKKVNMNYSLAQIS